jgi:hypothetical protein
MSSKKKAVPNTSARHVVLASRAIGCGAESSLAQLNHRMRKTGRAAVREADVCNPKSLGQIMVVSFPSQIF